MRAEHWRRHGSLGFKRTFILVRDTYGDTHADVVTVVASSSVSGLVEGDRDRNSYNIMLSRNADVHSSFSVDLWPFRRHVAS